MPETRRKKREKDDAAHVEDVKEEPKGKKKKKTEDDQAAKKGGGGSGPSKTKLSKISIEACNSWPRFKRMAKEYLEYFATFFSKIETEINPEKPRRGAFNIR